MRFRSTLRTALRVALVAAWAIAWRAEAQQPPVETFHVAETYNNAPFEYQSRLLSDRTSFRVYRLSYPSPMVTPVQQNNTVPADYYVPKNLQAGERYPAVICLHILDGDEQLTDLMCSSLAGRGIPAISFKLPYYGERALPKGPLALADDPTRLIDAIGQVGEDIRRTVDLLASRPEIDPEHIGITGISLGGITAATAAGAEPRLHRASLVLAGGDLLRIIYHARETRPLVTMLETLPTEERAKVEAKLAEVDPLRFAPALRDRARDGRVLMINAGADEVIPRGCTERLADALGIADRVTWLEGLGHYTAMAELPRTLRMTADFFAQDLPETKPSTAPAPVVAERTALDRFVKVLEQLVTMLTVEPDPGRCHVVAVGALLAAVQGDAVVAQATFVRGGGGRFALQGNIPGLGDVALGKNEYPWMMTGKNALFLGTKNPTPSGAIDFLAPYHKMKLRFAVGIAGGIVLAPDILQPWLTVRNDIPATGGPAIRIAAKDQKLVPGEFFLRFRDDGRTPASVAFDGMGVKGIVQFDRWEANVPASDDLFDPPSHPPSIAVDAADLYRMFAAVANYAADQCEIEQTPPKPTRPDAISVLGRDPAGHGMLCRHQGKTILLVSGTPAEMGAAQGTLARTWIQRLADRTVYFVGLGATHQTGDWFFDAMAEIQGRTLPHIPPRFLEECDALSKAAGISQRDGRCANLFPEQFHCSGAAIRGKATVGGRVLHAQVLDDIRGIDLQAAAAVQIFMPEGRHAWMGLGYTGFIGAVTAMNEKGLAVGEIGGRDEGRWDGVPMSFLLRDVMERAATVEEALAILRSTPRTCEYYYVLSDKSGDLRAAHCTADQMSELWPGQQDPRLPRVPDDTVLISGGDRAKVLSDRLRANFGRIDVPRLIEIVKRPVAMDSNLYDAIFAPETQEMWFADASRSGAACDGPYVRVSLGELLRFYRNHLTPKTQ